MFKIGEFSKLTQVSIRMLRYYDEMGLLKPAAIDKITNYRLYSTEQISTLNQIIFLRDLNFSVSEISVALHQWNNGFIAEQLEKKRQDIVKTIQTEQEKLLKIELAQKDIVQEKIDIHYNVTIKSVPSVSVLSYRQIVPDYYAEGRLWQELSVFAQKNHIACSSNTFTIYHDTAYTEKEVDIELCAPVETLGKSEGNFVFRTTEPVPIMACTMVYGGFHNIAGAYHAFAGWLQEYPEYRMTGQSRQIVHRGPWNETEEEKYLIEIQIPLEKI